MRIRTALLAALAALFALTSASVSAKTTEADYVACVSEELLNQFVDAVAQDNRRAREWRA